MDLLFCRVPLSVSPAIVGCYPSIHLHTRCFAQDDVWTPHREPQIQLDVLSEKVSLDIALVVQGLAASWLFMFGFQNQLLSVNLVRLSSTTGHA